jgi:hypothetical protein
MPSPFPGMNPYLERDTVWSDFHSEYCKAIKKALVPQVQPEFYVKFNEHIYVHEEPSRLVGLTDVSVTRKSLPNHGNGSVDLLDAPVHVRLTESFEERVLFVEIFDKEDHTLVTLIELLNPANKRKSAARDQFLPKRWQIMKSSVDYVEIDLLRGGPRLPMEGMPPCDYYVLVSRAAERPDMGLWPVSLRKPLPIVPIPLPAPKKEVRLALQELLNQAYDEAGYANYIYSGQPTPRLRADDARWAKRFMPAQ